MSGESWQVVVFTADDRRPFQLPDGYRWLPSELHTRRGKTHPCQIVNVPSKAAAEELAALAREHGLRGVIRPRFRETNTPQEPVSRGFRQASLGRQWLQQNEKPTKRQLRRKRARLRNRKTAGDLHP